MRIGSKRAWLDTIAFLLLFSLFVALGSRMVDNVIGIATFGVLVVASGTIIWRVWNGKRHLDPSKAYTDVWWASILPRGVFLWLVGEERDSKS